MKEAYERAYNNSQILKAAFTIGDLSCAVGVDSDSFTPWVRASVEFLDDVEFSFYKDMEGAFRPGELKRAARIATKHNFSFDLRWPSGETFRIRPTVK